MAHLAGRHGSSRAHHRAGQHLDAAFKRKPAPAALSANPRRARARHWPNPSHATPPRRQYECIGASPPTAKFTEIEWLLPGSTPPPLVLEDEGSKNAADPPKRPAPCSICATAKLTPCAWAKRPQCADRGILGCAAMATPWRGGHRPDFGFTGLGDWRGRLPRHAPHDQSLNALAKQRRTLGARPVRCQSCDRWRR